MCNLKVKDIKVGIDGCSVPTFGLPLRSAATAFARLADPTGLPEGRAEACRTIWQAMTTYPDMVAGPDRFDTQLMQISKGLVLTKGGAEGYQGISIAPGTLEEGAPGLGVALKIADGDRGGRARSILTVSILKELGALSEDQLHHLSDFSSRPVTNWRGIPVGELRPCFQLRRSL
jgi:L-asparaginase II